MKKIIALLLLLVMALGAVSCKSKVETPSGFQIASLESAPFYLYVPNTWTSNVSSGISSAYCASEGSVLVSAFSKKNEEEISLENYTTDTIENFRDAFEDFVLVTNQPEDGTLGSYKAYHFDYTATSGKKAFKYRTYISMYSEGFAILTYSAEPDFFEQYEEDFAQIVSKFTFKVQNEVELPEKDNTEIEETDGWQLASRLNYEYSFFVPKTWSVDKNGEFPIATYAMLLGDNSNVTLMSRVLSTPTTAEDYWAEAQKELLYAPTVLSVNDEAKLGGLSAYEVEYAYKIGPLGLTYRVKQVFCVTSNMVYVFTYTSNETYYETHLTDVGEMLNMFTFA